MFPENNTEAQADLANMIYMDTENFVMFSTETQNKLYQYSSE